MKDAKFRLRDELQAYAKNMILNPINRSGLSDK